MAEREPGADHIIGFMIRHKNLRPGGRNLGMHRACEAALGGSGMDRSRPTPVQVQARIGYERAMGALAHAHDGENPLTPASATI